MTSFTVVGRFAIEKLFQVSSDEAIAEAGKKGVDVIGDASQKLVPRQPFEDYRGQPHLADTLHTRYVGGGIAEARYSSVYAHWVHEGVEFNHPYGGSAKFLEIPTITEHDDILDACARVFRRFLP
jgi:hypothetical protein